jgi:hypothetical protein
MSILHVVVCHAPLRYQGSGRFNSDRDGADKCHELMESVDDKSNRKSETFEGAGMTMTTAQGTLWKQITQIYFQWDPDGNALMSVNELSDMLPAVPGDLIQETLANAKEDELAEFSPESDGGGFRPLRH